MVQIDYKKDHLIRLFLNDRYQNVKNAGKKYHDFRNNLMQIKNEGLTNIYNRFNNPNEKDSTIIELRNLHNSIDETVMSLYGWKDIQLKYGFGLDYLDLDEELQISENIMKKMDNDDVFFLDKNQAYTFEQELNSITKKPVKLSWKFRWPNDLKEEVISRLLSLNFSHYEEEVKEGLHIQGDRLIKKGKKSASGKLSIISKVDEQYEIDLNF